MVDHSIAMLNTIAAILVALLWTAMIAFGWNPCCCRGVFSNCCDPSIDIPLTLHAVISSPTCACMDGIEFDMVYGDYGGFLNAAWGGQWTADCGTSTTEQFSMFLYCTLILGVPTWVYVMGGTFDGNPSHTACWFADLGANGIFAEATCNPLYWRYESTFANVSGQGTPCACLGEPITITITP